MTAIALPRQRYSAWRDKLRSIRLGLGARGAVGLGLGASEPAAVESGVPWSQWFDHCWIAKGAASQAASYNDLTGSQTLTTGTAPAWDGVNGWHNFDGLSAYLETGLTPATTWSVLIAFADAVNDTDNLYLFGMPYFYITPFRNAASGTKFSMGLVKDLLDGGTLSGVLGMAGQYAFKNGSNVGAIATGPSPTLTIRIGMYSGLGLFTKAKIYALGLTTSTLTDGQMAAASAAMATL